MSEIKSLRALKKLIIKLREEISILYHHSLDDKVNFDEKIDDTLRALEENLINEIKPLVLKSRAFESFIGWIDEEINRINRSYERSIRRSIEKEFTEKLCKDHRDWRTLGYKEGLEQVKKNIKSYSSALS